jgi:hypothetical protein
MPAVLNNHTTTLDAPVWLLSLLYCILTPNFRYVLIYLASANLPRQPAPSKERSDRRSSCTEDNNTSIRAQHSNGQRCNTLLVRSISTRHFYKTYTPN